MILALAVAAWIGGGDINPLQSLSLPRIPVDEGPLTQGGAIASVIILLVTFGSAIAGGFLGERFHRAVDKAGVELPEPEASQEEETKTEAAPAPLESDGNAEATDAEADAEDSETEAVPASGAGARD
jgi:hypothetical protein